MEPVQPDRRVCEPEFARRIREARAAGRRIRLRVSGGLLAVGIPIALASMSATLLLFSGGMREAREKTRPNGAFLALSVAPPAWTLSFMALLPTDAGLIRATLEAATVSLIACFAFCCYIVALTAEGKFHYHDLTCQRDAPNHCWAPIYNYGGWAACFAFFLCWMLWIGRTKATAPVRFGQVYCHTICKAMHQYRVEQGTAKFTMLFLAAGFPGMFPGFWLERALPDDQCYVMPARMTLQSAWVAIRCFSVLVAVHWCATVVYSGVLSDARSPFDTMSGSVFGISMLLFMGILPSAAKRRRAMAFLRRLAQTAEEGEATTIGTLIGQMGAARAFEYATQTFRVVNGPELKAADFSAISYGVIVNSGTRQDITSLEFHRTQHADLGDCDAFISHSWRDDGTERWQSVVQWMSTFEASSGRTATFWIDALCLNQQRLDQSLAALPLYLAGCQQLLVLYGRSFPSRLWCIMELCARTATTCHALVHLPAPLRTRVCTARQVVLGDGLPGASNCTLIPRQPAFGTLNTAYQCSP